MTTTRADTPAAGGPDDPDSGLAVDVQDLHLSYGDTHAVRGGTLRVATGSVHAVLGPNGAGKTSMLDVLTGFRNPDAGSVRVLGHDPHTGSGRRAVRQTVGMVPQEGGHYPQLTVAETLDMHRGLHAVPRPLDELLDMAGLSHRSARRYRHLSGGERRRLDLAVALAGYPQLLVLDEPTTGFDPVAREHMWTVVRGLVDDGTTILLTTHYLEEAQALADQVTVIANGRDIATGSASELAERLQLGSLVELAIPADTDVPASLESVADITLSGGWLRARVADPADFLPQLCAWATASGVSLATLSVRPPTLEDTYRSLTEDGGT